MTDTVNTGKPLSKLARLVKGTVVGDKSKTIMGISGIQEAGPTDITFLANIKYKSLLDRTKAGAVVVSNEIDDDKIRIPQIRVENPSLAFVKIVESFSPPELTFYKGIHPTAVIGADVKIGKEVSIQAYAVIQDGCEIDDGTIIYPGVYVGHGTKIGKNCAIYPRVVIREFSSIGNNVIIHSGAIIGSDGFGYATVEGVHHKIPQIGVVIIEDDVEIGANTTLDRARFEKTIIRKGAKIDNLVQIAHNVEIGENSIVISLTALAGSTVVGRNVTIAGQVGISGHLSVGDNSLIAARAGVTKSVPPNSMISGFPAQSHKRELDLQAKLRRLPETTQRVRDLTDRIKQLEERLQQLEVNEPAND